ncbi:MAG: flagellar biosynthetic protein FliR [Thermoleophilaceae bacterium]
MNDLLAQFSESQVAGFLLVLARISPLFLLAPLFSSKMFPPRARGIAAVAITVGIAPLAMRGQEVPVGALELGGLMLKEILVGLAFAFAIAALFAAVQVAGSLVDTFTGFAFAAIVDPLTGNQSAVIHNLYTLIGVAIFVAIGGDAWVVQGLARSYDAIPLLATPDIGALVGGVNSAFAAIFVAGVEVAAPIVIALILTDVAFGLVSRVVPQLNVFAVGFPAKITVGLLIIGVSLPFVSGWLESELQTSVRTALDTLQVGVTG